VWTAVQHLIGLNKPRLSISPPACASPCKKRPRLRRHISRQSTKWAGPSCRVGEPREQLVFCQFIRSLYQPAPRDFSSTHCLEHEDLKDSITYKFPSTRPAVVIPSRRAPPRAFRFSLPSRTLSESVCLRWLSYRKNLLCRHGAMRLLDPAVLFLPMPWCILSTCE
jgi:hypothetical protein